MILLSFSIATFCVIINSVFVSGAIPTIEPNYATLYVLEFGPLNMTCTSEETDTLDWFRGTDKVTELGQGFQGSNKINVNPSGSKTMTVTIGKSSMTVADSGEYRCTSDSDDRTIKVEVVQAQTENAVYNKSSSSSTLVCKLLNLGPTVEYKMYWEFNGEMLQDDDKYTIFKENNTLVIKDPAHKDSGEYFCVHNFTENKQSLKVPVNYYSSPYVKKFDKSKNLIQGDPLTLRCEVYSFPPASITWFKDGKSVEGMATVNIMKDENTGLENGKLKINVVEFEDKGNYMCVAFSSYFNTSANRTILVRVKDKLAALWPFLGIVAEVIVLCVIIFIYEKKRSRSEEAEDAADAGNCANAADHKGKDEVRQRNVRA